jgi:hypothetical protein
VNEDTWQELNILLTHDSKKSKVELQELANREIAKRSQSLIEGGIWTVDMVLLGLRDS